MSLRLISKNDIVRTPLWHNESGVPFYLPMGSAPDGDEGDEEGDGDGDGDDGSGDDGDNGSEDRGKDGDEEKVSKADLQKALDRMKAADRRADAAEKKVREAEDKDKSALELAQQEAADAKAEAEKNSEALKTARIENAFLASNKIAWHNPSRALQMADLSEVSIDDDGKVDTKALEKALEALSKSDKYLVKSDKDGDEGGDASGSNVGGGRRGPKVKERKALEGKFPALSGR